MSDVLIKVESVSKKFCKDLKKGLWYGLKDVVMTLTGIESSKGLRPGEFWAIKDVSFEVKRGECVGLIGHNGAGKSTLLKMLNGLILPDEGRIEMNGKVGALIELGAGFNSLLTGRENIYINGSILGLTQSELDQKFDEIVSFSELEKFIDTPVQNYSSGMKVRLGFAIAAQIRPDILILDEVLAVGDASFRMKCFNKITELLESTAVIFVSHSMAQVSRICDTAIFLSNGKLLSKQKTHNAINDYLESIEIITRQKNINSNIIEIVSGRLVNEKGIVINSLKSGEYFCISVLIKVNNYSLLNNCRIMLVIFDAEMQNAVQIDENIVINNNGFYNIRLEIDNLQLKTGKYYINSVVLNGNKGDFIAVRDNIISFTSISSKDGYAPVFYNPKVTLDELVEI
jgi:lipopolysaccharide transport system ATP-binding protein